jgi:hypothetical protein
VLGHGSGEAFLHCFDADYAVELNGEFVDGGAAEMEVSIVEARHDKAVVELDGFGIVASGAFEHYGGEFADADDFAVADGHGGSPGVRGIIGVDAGVEVERGARGIGGWCVLGAERWRDESKDKDGTTDGAAKERADCALALIGGFCARI